MEDFTSLESSQPSLDAAYQYLVTDSYDVLVVYKLDRLARDTHDRQTIEMTFEQRGARICYVLGNYDDTPDGEVRKDIQATFSKWEKAKGIERSMRGMRAKAESGLFVAGRAPFGYSINRKAFGGLEVNQAQAEIVNRIFDLCVHDGLSMRAIAELFSVEGVVNHSGNTSWGYIQNKG